MRAAQGHVGQEQRCQHHHEQGPQVVDQVGLDRWRMAQRQKQQKMKAKQPINAERQRGARNPPRSKVKIRQRQGNHTADQQGQPGQQKGWHM